MSFGAYLTTFGTGTMAKLLLSIQLPNDKLMKIGSNKSSKITVSKGEEAIIKDLYNYN